MQANRWWGEHIGKKVHSTYGQCLLAERQAEQMDSCQHFRGSNFIGVFSTFFLVGFLYAFLLLSPPGASSTSVAVPHSQGGPHFAECASD